MDDNFIVTTFVITAKLVGTLEHRDDVCIRAISPTRCRCYYLGVLSVRVAQRLAVRSPPARVARLAAARSRDTRRALRLQRGILDRRHARAGLLPRPRGAVPDGQPRPPSASNAPRTAVRAHKLCGCGAGASRRSSASWEPWASRATPLGSPPPLRTLISNHLVAPLYRARILYYGVH